MSTEQPPNKPPGSGPTPITMDVYHQMQQKRRQERQQEEEQQKRRKADSSEGLESHTNDINIDGHHSQSKDIQSVQSLESNSYRISGMNQPSLDTLDQIVNIAQATAPPMPLLSQPQQIPIPGPDLANIIFRHNAPTVPTVENDTTAPFGALKPNAAGDVHTTTSSAQSHHHQYHQHSRKSGPGSNSQPHTHTRTTSPPTPVAATPSGAHKSHNVKGPRSIHAIELIRISGEILQFPPTTIGTALIYYHKYRAYLHQAHKRGERDNEATKGDEYLFATACLHLASKCTEVSRKVRDIVNVTYRVMNPSQPVLSLSTKPDEDKANKATTSTPSNSQSSQPHHSYPTAPPPTVHTYWHIRDSLLTTELMLLRILQFDLDVPLPFSDVLRICKGMGTVFSPSDDESAQRYPAASNFDVFLPATTNKHPGTSSSSSSSPNKHGTPSSSSSSSSAQPISPMVSSAPHTGIHPTLSALVQISITFCIDALCSSNIALNSSSRALAMGSIYLAVRSVGLELPMPFQEWCYAWGSPNIAAGFGVQVGGTGGMNSSSLVPPGVQAGIGSNISGVNGILGLSSGGTNNLFVTNPRLAASTSTAISNSDSTSVSNGLTGVPGANGAADQDSVRGSQTNSPLQSNSNSPSAALASPNTSQESQQQQQQLQPLTIVDEVRKVVQELGTFYVH